MNEKVIKMTEVKKLYGFAIAYYHMKQAQLHVSDARRHTDDIFGMYLSNWDLESSDAIIQLGVSIKILFPLVLSQIADGEIGREGDYHALRFGRTIRLEIGDKVLTVFLNDGIPDVQLHRYGL